MPLSKLISTCIVEDKHYLHAYMVKGFEAPNPLGDNTTRMHPSLGHQSLIEFELEFKINTKAAIDSQSINTAHPRGGQKEPPNCATKNCSDQVR